jgi:hypothetical protein
LDGTSGGPPASFKWIVIGCGGLSIAGLLGIGGITIAAYLADRRASEIARVGAEYLKAEPRIAQAVGEIHSIERQGRNGRVKGNDAYFVYKVLGTTGAGQAEVWLRRGPGGPWQASGAIFEASAFRPGRTPGRIRLGSPGVSPSER